MNKQPEVTVATRKRIMAAFFTLYKTTRIEKITVGKIAAEAHINRSTFYEYFSDIYDLFDQYEQEWVQALAGSLSALAPISQAGDFAAMLSECVVPFAEDAYYLSRYDPALNQKLAPIMQPVFMAMFVGKEPPEFSDYLYTMAASVAMTNLTYWYEHREQYALEELVRIMYGFFSTFASDFASRKSSDQTCSS